MTSEWKKSLLEILDTEIESAKVSVAKTDEASKFIVTGWSQSGDKYHAQMAADLAASYLKRLKDIRNEIEKSEVKVMHKVEPVSFVEVEYEDRSKLSFTYVANGVSLTRSLFISTNSPLGKAILGKIVRSVKKLAFFT